MTLKWWDSGISGPWGERLWSWGLQPCPVMVQKQLQVPLNCHIGGAGLITEVLFLSMEIVVEILLLSVLRERL